MMQIQMSRSSSLYYFQILLNYNLKKVLDLFSKKLSLHILFKLAVGLFWGFFVSWHKYCWLHDVMAIEQWHYLSLNYFPVNLALIKQFCLPQASNVPGKWKLTEDLVRLRSISVCIHVSIRRLNEGINTLVIGSWKLESALVTFML